LVIRCLIEELTTLPRWFFTDGQGNDMASSHYNNLQDLGQIDWDCIQQSDFSKGDNDYDRPRRYQAEFLIYKNVPLDRVESLNVYNQNAADFVNNLLNENNINLAVNIQQQYFF